MTPEQQRIAIAEACGWTLDEPDDFTGRNTSPQGRVYSQQIRKGFKSDMNYTDRFSGVPNYLNDLNAMHEAEKLLRDGNKITGVWWDYRSNLIDIQDRAGEYSDGIHATAAQRAEAFLRTLNLFGTLD